MLMLLVVYLTLVGVLQHHVVISKARGLVEVFLMGCKSGVVDVNERLFLLLAVADLLGGVAIGGSVVLLFNLEFDDSRVNVALRIIGWLLSYFQFMDLVSFAHNSVCVFQPHELAVSDIIMTWLVHLLSVMILVPMIAATGSPQNYLLLVLCLIQGTVVLFFVSRINTPHHRNFLCCFVVIATVCGLSYGYFVADDMKNLLLSAKGKMLVDSSGRSLNGRPLPTPSWMYEYAVSMCSFLLSSYAIIGGICGRMFYRNEIGGMAHLCGLERVAELFDAIFKFQPCLLLFPVVVPLYHAVKSLWWLHDSFWLFIYATNGVVVSDTGRVSWVEEDEAEAPPAIKGPPEKESQGLVETENDPR